jgi:pimeloyl-[acyl-carrier protein] synthase
VTLNGRPNPKSAREFSLFQLLKPEVLADPYPLYQHIREFEPVHWDLFLHSWVVTSYAETVVVLSKMMAARTPAPESMEAKGLGVLSPYARMMQRQLLFIDAPDHTRIRTICATAFTPKRVHALRETVQATADSLIDRIVPSGEMDVVADFAGQFPALVLAALIGLPAEDHAKLRRWACDFGELIGNFEHDPDRMEALALSLEELTVYIGGHVSDQMMTPRDGLISTLSETEADGARMTFDEIVANTILMIAGGLEETTNLIANGMFSLLSRPEQHAQLAAHPEILPSAIEEILRFESTTQYTGRVAHEDMQLGGKQIRKGDAVTVVLAAANRDPLKFDNPNELNLTRRENRHVALSYAAHYCLGAPLARMAGRIAFGTILQRLPALTLVTTQPRWRGMAAMRGVEALHVTFHSQDI